MSVPRLADKVAIVTGASSGIGRQLALAAAAEGAAVVCSDLTTKTRDPAVSFSSPTHEAINQTGQRAIFVKADVGKEEDVQALVAKAVEEYGRLDIMFNNAGIAIGTGDPKNIWELDGDQFDKVMHVNVRGVFNGCKYASAQMIKQEPHPSGSRGWIVNTASILGHRGTPQAVGYSTSKHAVVGLTKCVALDCAPHKIHVNAFCPGWTDSAFLSEIVEEGKQWAASKHPWGGSGLGKPAEIARAALFLATEDAKWVTGSSLTIDGGYTAM